MARSGTIALMMLAGASAATPAFAQFDNIFRGTPLEAIFGGPPPRPPGDIRGFPGERERRDPYLQPPGPPPGSRIRGESLPPPPGSPRSANYPANTPVAPPPGQRPQAPQRGSQPEAPPPPPSETIVEPSAQKITN